MPIMTSDIPPFKSYQPDDVIKFLENLAEEQPELFAPKHDKAVLLSGKIGEPA